ncbi:MAG: glycosyltransferase [Thermoanaerobaculia bacterium]
MTSPPRVALVHDWLTGMRGGEKVLEEIADLFPAAPIYSLFHLPGRISPALEAHPIRTSFLQRAPLLARRYRQYLPLFPIAVEDLDVSGFDLVISSSHCVAKGAVRGSGAVHVCYCHTPMRYVWDQRPVYFPRRRTPVDWLRQRLLDGLQRWDVATADRVDLYLANSHFVADRIRRYYGRAAEVVPPPVDIEFFTSNYTAAREPFALAVSALVPYKRLDLAIEACGELGIELRIVGTGPEHDRLRALGGDGARLLGQVGPEELRDLYRRAFCFVQPGVEDFGIAAVEALACGLPVVARGEGGVRDIVRPDRDGVLYDDDGPAALAAALDKARRSEFNTLDLRRRAEMFSRERFRRSLSAALVAAFPELEGALS